MKILILAATILLTICPYVFSMDFYVATDGCDTNPGTKAQPFATIEKARDTIRQSKKGKGLPPDGMAVWLKGGVYKLKETIEFNQSDSGTKESRIIYRSLPNEKVIFEGGVTIDSSKFQPISNSDILNRVISKKAEKKILQVDLKAQGITEFGQIEARGFGIHNFYSWPELIFDGKPMQLAQWPNKGFVKVTGVPDANNNKTFTYDTNRPTLWEKAEDVWALGFWEFGWAESLVKLGAINTKEKTITIASKFFYGLTKEGLWRAINLLEEIDTPGEWFLDRTKGTLYFWPPENLKGQKIEMTYFDKPVMVLKKVSNVTIRGITLRNCRGSGIEVADGRGVSIEGCTLQNMG
ncbi:MAG: right-handed parallel beta-helix repeat-containing protein, partial [Planctomycetota bacterium]